MSKVVYYEVIPSGANAVSALTYHSPKTLRRGQIVRVPYGKKELFGIITQPVEQPDFETKEISKILDLPSVPDHTIDLIDWISDYYEASPSEVARLFLPNRPDINSTHQRPSGKQAPNKHTLRPAQQQAIERILEEEKRLWLMHGVTGSGKTAVYIELCQAMLDRKQSVVVLVPEITLATQVIAEFERELGQKVLITHSRMSERERRAIWREALCTTEPVVVIGPRSALFAPRSDIGLVIIDECHENSYKQEQSPHYHARDVAAKLSELTDAKVVLGSATPSAADIFLSRQGMLSLVELPEPIHSNARDIDIVDMRKKMAILSPQLETALRDTLKHNQQTLLFLNRRGSASQVLCADCGEVRSCRDCEIPQTWHGDSGRLRCHWCGVEDKLPARCPQCNSMKWRFLGIGTKRIEAEINRLFPQARTLRLDGDSFSADTIEDIITKLRDGEIDILIGTQMVAKGLDLPQVTLVGVVLADTLLHIPDIYSNERTYQLLHQVIGRAGRRADQPARVVIQTYAPEHPAIRLAAQHRFHEFIDTELSERKTLGYPPYRYVLKLTCKRKTQKGAKNASQRLAKKIEIDHPEVTVRGPAPAWREQLGGAWYWHIILTSAKRGALNQIVRELPSNWRADLDPNDLL